MAETGRFGVEPGVGWLHAVAVDYGWTDAHNQRHQGGEHVRHSFAAIVLISVFFSGGAAAAMQSRAGRAPLVLHAEAAPSPTPPIASPEQITVAPSVAVVAPNTQIEAPVTAAAQANAQPLTPDGSGGSKRRLLFGAAGLAALMGIVLLVIAVRSGRRSEQK
jgi:hypothetical protein